MKSTNIKFTKYSIICQYNIEIMLYTSKLYFSDKTRLEYPNIKGLFQFLFCVLMLNVI